MNFQYNNVDPELLQKAAKVEWLVLDVDGVMTDGSLGFGDDGQEYKRFHARDGLGLKMWLRAGFKLAIITARKSDVVAHRAHELTVSELYQGATAKHEAMHEIAAKHGLGNEKFAFVGDDLVDYQAMQYAGFAITVADAYPAMHSIADWSSSFNGGNGALRDTCELILHSKGLRENIIADYTGAAVEATASNNG